MSEVDVASVASSLEKFLRDRFRIRPEDPKFNHQVNLWDAGYVDSYGTADLIVYLEETFGIHLPDDALFAEDNTNVQGLAKLVCRLKAGGQPES